MALDRHKAHSLLVKNGFKVLTNSPYPYPVVLDSTYEEVKQFLMDNDYRGDFLCIRKLKTAKGSANGGHSKPMHGVHGKND